MNINFRVLVIWMGLCLCGCSVVPPAEEIMIYQFPESGLQPGSDSADVTLKIMSVESSDALNSRRILVSEDGVSLHALPGSRWASPVRNLLRDRLVESMRADRRLAHITSDTSSLRSDVELHSTLRNFVGDFSGQPAAYIRLDVVLTDPATRRIMASREFSVRNPSAGKSADDLVAAFAGATDQLAQALVNWITAEVSN